MTSVALSPLAKQRFVDANGHALAGGLLYTYVSGTSTPQPTYLDASGTTPNTNPVVLDAQGQCALWLNQSLTYTFTLKDSRGVLQWSADNVTAPSKADVLTPQRFGAPANGVADDLAACVLARDSVASGQAVHIHFPRAAYYLSADFTANGRKVFVTVESGATFAGPGIVYIQRKEQVSASQRKVETQGDANSNEGAILGDAHYITSNGTTAGYGDYINYNSFVGSPTNANGGDIAQHVRAQWHSSTNTGLFARWVVAIAPITAAAEKNWGLVCEEANPVDHGPDRGWAAAPGAVTWSGAYQVVPESWAPTGYLGGNILFAYAVFKQPTINQRGPGTVPSAAAPFYPRSYNGYLVGDDAIAPNGRAFYAGGSASASSADFPFTPYQIEGKWLHGIYAPNATFNDNVFAALGANHTINFGSAAFTHQRGNFTATPAGLTTAPTFLIYYTKNGDQVTLDFTGGCTGTSNATTFTLTGMPPALRPTNFTKSIAVRVKDNSGSFVWGLAQIDTAGVITLYASANQTAFTASGTKAIGDCSASYTLN